MGPKAMMGARIGAGAFGQVYEAFCTDGTCVAVKRL